MKLGKAFGDNLLEEKKSTNRWHVSEPSWWLGTGRVLIFITFFIVSFFILSFRLIQLTVVHGHEYRNLANSNRVRELVRHAPRGKLLDRAGKELVVNIPRYRLLLPCADTSVPCVQQLSEEQKDAAQKKGLPNGAYIEMDWGREYLGTTEFAHVLGYIGELTSEELKKEYYQLRHYKPGDRVGRIGGEAVFEERLRGRDGRELVEIDAQGNIVRSLGKDLESSGEDIHLAIDFDLSRIVANAFPKEFDGAVVVSKPDTGEILAIYSNPSFDPNLFTKGMTIDDYQNLLEDPREPMFDRAIGGVYPPGSTYKLVTAVAGLEEGVIQGSTTVDDVGVLKIGIFEFPNWYFKQYGRTDGAVNLAKALQRSNDIYFYKVGEWLGITKLGAWSQKMGLGKPTGIELSGEAGGLMPDPVWKNLHFTTKADRDARNNEWYLGDTYHVSIGQGYLLTTPLQVNTWTNIVANNGKICEPTIEKVSSGANSKNPSECKDVGIKKETIDLVTEGMIQACETGGTGWPLFDFTVTKIDETTPVDSATQVAARRLRIPIACKTGTAEFGDPEDKTHAWFTAFGPVPAEDMPQQLQSGDGREIISGPPEISVTVLVEKGGEGSSVAAPIAKKILEAWFSR